MAAPVNANINILVNTSQATAQLRSLQAQIAATNRSIGANSGAAAAQQAALSKALMDGANASRMWNARVVPMSTATQQFSDALDRGKMSLGQYTRYASSQLPGMSRIFKREFNMMTRVAEQNVRRMQTQYVALGNNAAGAAQAMALTPTALSKQAAATQVAAQRQMMMNRMIDLGSTKLLNWGKNTQWAGRQLMVGFSLPLAMMGAAAAKAFKEIDQAEISFKRVYGNLQTTTEEMERNLEAVKELGQEYTKYGKSMASTIEIASRVAATGATGEALTAGTEQTIRLATLGLMEYDEALDATISLQTAFKIENEDLASTIDFLNVVENETILTMQDMAAAIPRVAPVVRGLGGDVQDLAVMMTALREGGVTAEQGANAIKSGLGRLINPTKAAKEMMASFGISIESIVLSNKGDLMGMLTDFGNALARLGDFEQQQVLEKVFGKYQYARLGALFKNLASDSGQAARAIELTSMSVEDLARISDRELSKIEEATSVKFQAGVEKMKIAIAPIGETFLKILTPIVDIVTKIADSFNNLPDGIKNAITIAVAAIAGIGPVILMIVGLVANGVANIVKFIQMVRRGFARLKKDSSAFGYLTQKEQEAAAAAAGLSGATDTLTGKFVGQQKALERLIELLSIYSGRLGSVAGMAIPGAAGAGGAKTKVAATAAAPAKAPMTFFTPMGRMVPPKTYADGVSKVPGTGNKDTVPALLTPGESVITKSATKKYGSIISAMNAGTIKMMATAGAASGSLPPASSMMLMGGSSYALNPGAIFGPGNQSAFGLSKTFMTRGSGLIDSIVGALVGTARVVEIESGAISKNARMTRSYFDEMQAEVRPAAEGIAQDIRDTWREMTKAEKEAATIDDVIAKARNRINARLVALSETGVRGAAAAQGASRFLFNPASQADLMKYGDIRAAAVVRTAEGKYIDKPLRPSGLGLDRGVDVGSRIKTATGYAFGGAVPAGWQYAHLVTGRRAGPEIPMQGGAMGASPAIKSEMMARLAAYQSRSDLYKFNPQTEAMIRQEMARVAAVGGETYVGSLANTISAGQPRVTKGVKAALSKKSPAGWAAPFGTEDGTAYGSAFNNAVKQMLAASTAQPVPPAPPVKFAAQQKSNIRYLEESSRAAGSQVVKAQKQALASIKDTGRILNAGLTNSIRSIVNGVVSAANQGIASAKEIQRMNDRNFATRRGVDNAASRVGRGVQGAVNIPVVPKNIGTDLDNSLRFIKNVLVGSANALRGTDGELLNVRNALKQSARFVSTEVANAWKNSGIKTSLAAAGRELRTSLDNLRIVIAEQTQKLRTAATGLATSVGGWWNKEGKGGQTRGQRIGGAANSAVMGLMGLSMAASFAGGEIGEMAQKIMPVTMGLMGLQMILPMLKSPLGLAIIAIGALTALFVKARMDLDNFARSAAEAGANLGGVANRLSEMSAATGYTFASQRAKDRLFRIDPDQKESMSQFAEYFESERGQKFLDNLRNLTSADRYNEVAKMLSMAIADGMDEETAKAYGYSIAYYLNDAVMQQKLKLDFAANNFAAGIDKLISIIEERQNAIDALGGYRPVGVGQSSASRGLANMTGIGKYDTQQSMFAEGVGKTGLAAGAGALALGGGMFAAGTMTAMGGTMAGLVAGATMTSWAGPLAIIGAIAGAAIGGLVAWKQYNDQVARLNENVGSAAMMMGNSIQVLGELRGAEQLLIEKRQEGKISAEEYAAEMARLGAIEAKATTNMATVIQSMMMGGEVDTGALNQALKSQLVIAGFEGDLAEAVVGTVNVENVAKALFPTEDIGAVLEDQAKRSAITAVMIESLAGITPENAKQRISDVTTQWGAIGSELVTAAEDGLTQDEARAVLAGKRAGQIIMDRLLSGTEGAIEDYSTGTTQQDYAKAADALARIAAGDTENLPEGVTIAESGENGAPRVEVNGRVYEGGAAGEQKSLGELLAERSLGGELERRSDGALTSESLDAMMNANKKMEEMFGDLTFSPEDIQSMLDTAKGLGMNMEEFLATAMSDPIYGQALRDNINSALEDEEFDWMQLEGLDVGKTNQQIKEAVQLALDMSDIKLEFPEIDVQDIGTPAEVLAGEVGKWRELPSTQTAIEERGITPEQLDVGLAAAADTIGQTGLEGIVGDTDKMNALLDLIQKLNTAEFAGVDIASAIEEVFGSDGALVDNFPEIQQNLENFEDTYSGLGNAFEENSQKVIDYLKETAATAKEEGETTEEYIKRQAEAAKGYGDVLKSMPTEMKARLGIDMEDPSTFMEIGPHLEQIIKMWPILSTLDKNVDISAAVEAGLLTTENGEYKTTGELLRDVKAVNKTWKEFGKAETLEAKKKIITDFAVENQGVSPEDAESAWNTLEEKFGPEKLMDMGTDQFKKTFNIALSITANEQEIATARAALQRLVAAMPTTPQAIEAWQKQVDELTAIIEAGEIALAQGQADLEVAGSKKPKGDDTGGSSSGGGSKDSPLKSFREDILNMAKMWTDATMNMEKLNNAKMSFADQVMKGAGIFNKLRKIKGLPTDAIRQIMEMGPEGSEAFIKKYTKDGKLTTAGRGFLEAQAAGRINEMMGQDRLSNLDTRRRTRAARSLMGEQGVTRETFNFIAEDTDRLDAYWELKRRANKGDKEAAADLEKFLKLQGRKVRREKEFNESLMTGVELAKQQLDEYASKQNAFFDKAFADIEKQADIQFEADYGQSVSDMEYQIKLNEDLIDGHRERIQVLNDEIRTLETKNGTAKDYSDWGLEQIQKEIDANKDLINSYERQNELAQRRIDALRREDELRMRVSDELSHDLDIMSDAETKINEAYDKRIEALDTVESVNKRIIEQQQQQLGLSQALSEGDIYAATAAVQEMQASSVQFASEQVRASLEQGRENEIAGLRTASGLTREEAEKQIADIKEQSYQTSLNIRKIEDDIYNRNINDILPLKDKEYNLNLALQKVQDSIAAKQLEIRDVERGKIEPLERQNALMKEQIDDHLLKIEGKQREIKNAAGQTRDEFERMNNWLQADLAWQEAMTEETERAEKKARDLALMWKNVGKQIQNAKDALTKDLEDINVRELGEDYTEEDRQADREKAQKKYDDAVAKELAAATQQTVTDEGGLVTNAFAGGLMKKKYAGGGSVLGSGSRDSISAMLAPGEFVVRKAMVDKYGMPMFNAINQGSFSMPRYNTQSVMPRSVGVKEESGPSLVAPMYNNYSVNVSVSNSNASADDIANKTIMKIKQINDMQIRGGRGY